MRQECCCKFGKCRSLMMVGSAHLEGGFFASAEEVRYDQTDLSYYYSNVNLNPRLPPPLLSKEDRRFGQRVKGCGSVLGGVGDTRKVNGSRPCNYKESELEKGNAGLICLSRIGTKNNQKTRAEICQGNLSHVAPVTNHPSRPSIRKCFNKNANSISPTDAEVAKRRQKTNSSDAMRSSENGHTSSASQNIGSYAAVLGSSLSRTNMPGPVIARSPSPCLTPIGGERSMTSYESLNNLSSAHNEAANLAPALSGLNLSQSSAADDEKTRKPQTEVKGDINHQESSSGLPQTQTHANQYQFAGNPSSPFDIYRVGGFSSETMVMGLPGTGELPPLYKNAAASSQIANQMLGGGALVAHYVDPSYLHYLGTNHYAAAQLSALNGASGDMNYLGNSYLNMLEMQNAYLVGPLVSLQNSMYNPPVSGQTGFSNHHGFFYSNQAVGGGVSYPGTPMRQNDQNMDGIFGSSLVQKFKNHKTTCFSLSEIAGHVVEFSSDQYGSRFIQQKFETATIEEKNMVYQEIMPHALDLMTDLFGNYVIQKLLVHGLASHRRELAGKLQGHVLSLSCQMYGCRVIQKAMQVVDLDQKIMMAKELDGHVMHCIRDQNGNHVIQRCIDCIPEDAIGFLISTFFGQVANLSTHPYGCRVIQRLLGHCKDPTTQSKVMDEILGCISMLAQDQYGNYVVQYVLKHGKPRERSTIIKNLTGNMVEMSQQKYASNVVEKCFVFGSAEERQRLVDEMLGKIDENAPLQAMMVDQFGNYVVQKVLETCDESQRELILSRIKVHLATLKNFSSGKHIVARVEKLVVTAERRIAARASGYRIRIYKKR